MRDGQGCLLPVRHSHSHTQQLLHTISSHACWSTSPESEASPCIFSVPEGNKSIHSSRSAELEVQPLLCSDSSPADSSDSRLGASFSCLVETESDIKTLRFAEPETNLSLRSAITEELGSPGRLVTGKRSLGILETSDDPDYNASQILSNGEASLSDRNCRSHRTSSAASNCSRCFVRSDEEGSKRLKILCQCQIACDEPAEEPLRNEEDESSDGEGNRYVGGYGDANGHVDANGYVDVNVYGDDDYYQEDQQQPYLPGLDDETALRCLAFVRISDIFSLSKVARRYRDLVRSRFILKLRRLYGVKEHWVFIYTSGPGGWWAYESNRNAWSPLPAPTVDPAFELSDRESLSAGTHVLWLGKGSINFIYYRYDLLSSHWEKGPDMVNPRCLFGSASCGDFAFVAGGFGCNLKLLSSAERYNSNTGQWEALPSMSTPRHKCSGFFMDDKFYVIGGRDAHHKPIMSAEEYNPATGKWRTIENMYFAQEAARMDGFEPSPPLVAVVNNELYAVDNSTNKVKLYNKQTNTWSDIGYIPVPANLRNGWGVAFKALGDKLFVMGDTGEGIISCCWQPGPNTTAPDWQILSHWERGADSFLFNCAVMSC